MKVAFLLLVISVAALGQDPQGCLSPKPATDFKYDLFEGWWYEIGHFRNAGALIWNLNCVCSTVNVTRDQTPSDVGDSLMTFSCNEVSQDEEATIFDTDLVMMNPPGKWQQIVAPLPLFDAHEFVVLEMTEDYALTYRCGDYFLVDSYSILILSRKPSLDEAVVEKLIKKVDDLKLNTEKAIYIPMEHANCTYTDHGY